MKIQIISTIILETSPGWISIEERTPPVCNEVLFLIKNSSTDLNRCFVSTYHDRISKLNAYDEITHWKEIPY